MLKSILNDQLRTHAYVLTRINYGEADRILNLITPHGKIVAIAKGVRREKSKLAGNVEIFTLADYNLHIGKSDFAVVTSVRMIKFYSEILKDLVSIKIAGEILKKINILADSSDNPEYFVIVDQVLNALNTKINRDLVKIWASFNIAKASGEEINLYRSSIGEKLDIHKRYSWDFNEKVLVEDPNGEISADEIKVMRLILTNKLTITSKIKNIGELIPPILKIAQSF